MSLTPFHLGPGLILGALTLNFLNLWAILLGSIVPDIEPLVLLMTNRCYFCPHHGPFHSIFGAIFGSLILAVILYGFREKLNKISLKFRINQPFSFKVLFSSSLVGWLLHVFFDSLTHYDVLLFWPYDFRPLFFGKRVYWPLTLIFLISGIIGLIFISKKKKNYA